MEDIILREIEGSKVGLQWGMYSKSQYTFIPVPSITRDIFIRHIPLQVHEYQVHKYPYENVPELECHIAPPFAVINGGPTCMDQDLEVIAADRCKSSVARGSLKRQLEMVSEIWEIIQGAKEDAKKWESQSRGKRKREIEDEDIERLSRSSGQSTRSRSRASRVGQEKVEVRSLRSQKRKAACSLSRTMLTESAVLRLSKQQRRSDVGTKVKEWVLGLG